VADGWVGVIKPRLKAGRQPSQIHDLVGPSFLLCDMTSCGRQNKNNQKGRQRSCVIGGLAMSGAR
jgi:hypothetical protein